MILTIVIDPSLSLPLARALFFLCAGLLLYTYLLYPLVLALMALLNKNRPRSAEYEPTVSLLICAYNEEAGIAEKLRNTLLLDYPKDKLEIVVISDGSCDRTEEIVQTFSAQGVRLLRTSRRLGKTNAQNEAIACCTGEIVVFSDATTTYDRSALRILAAAYHDPRVGAVSGRYQYLDPDGSSPTGVGSSAFWNYENQIKYLQSRILTLTGCCGCIYSVRRHLYTALPADIISDLVQPLQIIKQGYAVVFEDRALAFEVPTETSQQELTMRIRVITRGMRGILSVRSLLNPLRHPWIAFQLISHKVMRWFVPFYLIGLFVSSVLLAGQPAFAILLAAQLLLYLVALLSLAAPLHRLWKPLGIPLYFCTLNFAALISLFELLRGRNYVVWETVRS